MRYINHEATKRSCNLTETGWWLTYPSEKYEFVSWGYNSQYMESQKKHVPNFQTFPNHQPEDFSSPQGLMCGTFFESTVWYCERNPNHQLIGGKHPTISRLSTKVVQDFVSACAQLHLKSTAI